MKLKSAAIIGGIALSIAAIFFATQKLTAKKTVGKNVIQESLTTHAPFFLVEEKQLRDSIPGLIGTIKGNTVELTFNGQEDRLARIHVNVGQKVKKNQILFELDHTRTQARLNQARSAYIRTRELYNVGGATEHDLKDAESVFQIARKDHQDTFVHAPTAGTVSQINKAVGETIGRTDVVGVFVSAEGRLVMETGVIESQLDFVRNGQKALVELDALRGKEIVGTVLGVSREVTTSGRTGTVLIALPMTDQKLLRPGLSARCEIFIFDKPATVIPRHSYDAKRQGVFVVSESGKAAFKPVKIGHITRDFYEVIDGLSGNETIVADLISSPVEEGTALSQEGELMRFSPADEKES